METRKKIICAAIYIRVSTEEQVRHGYSLNSQKERLIDYCKQKNYKITEIYADEGKSARSKLNSRKELIRLINDAKLKKFDRIVFWRLDRWFRNISDYYKIQEILEKNHIDWECSDEEYNTTTSNGRLHLNIKLSIAQNESDQTSDRIKFNFNNMVKNKKAIQGSHCMPLGYKVVGEEKNKHVVKDEETKDIVNDMFEHFKIFNSMRQTMIYINNKYNLSINYYSICHYFKNELYTGIYRGIENYCEPYITKDEFLENQKRIKRNAKSNHAKYDYIFRGLLKCSECGHNLAGFTHATTKPKYNKKYKSPAYRCNKAYNSKLCTNRSPILESSLEKYLLANFKEHIKDMIIKYSLIEAKQELKKIDIKKIESKINRITDLYIEGKISKEKFEENYKLFSQELENAKKMEDNKKDLSIYNELLKSDINELYEKLDNESKRAFWLKYIDYIERNKDLQYIIHFK